MTFNPAFHLNAPGDFYVGGNECMACHAPEHEAPELMSHDASPRGSEHCYFKRQPCTPEEISHAIEAIKVSCCGAVRYGGSDPAIIARVPSEAFVPRGTNQRKLGIVGRLIQFLRINRS